MWCRVSLVQFFLFRASEWKELEAAGMALAHSSLNDELLPSSADSTANAPYRAAIASASVPRVHYLLISLVPLL